MQLGEPVYQVLAILVRNFALEASVQEVGWIHMPNLLFPHVAYDFWDELNNRLWVSDLQNIIEVELRLVFPQPFFPPIFLSIKYFFEFLLIKVRLHQVQCWLLRL